MFDIEGRMTDRKTYDISRSDGGRSVTAGHQIHDMSIRLTVDDSLRVHAIEAITDAAPFVICPQAIDAMQQVVGLKIGAGWTRAVKDLLGGARGCTHLMELLNPIATTAYQTMTIVNWKKSDKLNDHGKPAKIDSCYSYQSSKEVVLKKWPTFFTGITTRPVLLQEKNSQP
jgi:hypothetical protein